MEWATRPLRKFSDFAGRAPRAEFWWFYLLMLTTIIIATIIDTMIGSRVFGPYGIVACLAYLALLLPYLAVAVRRLHDTGRTGWWMVAPLVLTFAALTMMGPSLTDPRVMSNPAAMAEMGTASLVLLAAVILGLVVLVFFLMPGTRGSNRYGEDPYGGGAVSA
jgi:uncharacterized membrane protein YhaH (DUF805 family)